MYFKWGSDIMNMRTMRMLFNIGRQSQKVTQLFRRTTPNRINMIKNIISYASVIMSAIQLMKKTNNTLTNNDEQKNVQNNNITKFDPNRRLQALPLAEMAEEMLGDFDKKNTSETEDTNK